VAAEMDVNVNTAKLWSRSFGWKRRVSERDHEVIQQVRERTVSDAIAEIERNLKMIRAAKNKVMKDILEGKAKSTSGDLAKFIQLERELLRELDPTGSHGRDPHATPGVIIYVPDNGRSGGPGGRHPHAVDINNPLHPDYRKPEAPDASGDTDPKEPQ
jgi:hypothetical protein